MYAATHCKCCSCDEFLLATKACFSHPVSARVSVVFAMLSHFVLSFHILAQIRIMAKIRVEARPRCVLRELIEDEPVVR